MKISNLCKNYFNGFQEISHCKTNTKTKTFLAALKIFTYFTLLIPATVTAVYGISCLCGRISKKSKMSIQDKKVQSNTSPILLRPTPKKQKPDPQPQRTPSPVLSNTPPLPPAAPSPSTRSPTPADTRPLVPPASSPHTLRSFLSSTSPLALPEEQSSPSLLSRTPPLVLAAPSPSTRSPTPADTRPLVPPASSPSTSRSFLSSNSPLTLPEEQSIPSPTLTSTPPLAQPAPHSPSSVLSSSTSLEPAQSTLPPILQQPLEISCTLQEFTKEAKIGKSYMILTQAEFHLLVLEKLERKGLDTMIYGHDPYDRKKKKEQIIIPFSTIDSITDADPTINKTWKPKLKNSTR